MLNETIKALRKAKGLSQEELAIKLNVVRQTISKWEKGLSVPDAGMLTQIADALDITVNVILGGEVPESAENETKAIAAKLELLNEQFAKRTERHRKIWRTVFVTVGIFSLIGLGSEVLSLLHMHQVNEIFETSTSIIGGTDAPTSIYVSSISLREASFLFTGEAAVAAAVGVYQTRQK